MDGKRIRIGVSIPCIGSIPVIFFQNFINVILTNMGKYTLDVDTSTPMPVDRARNESVERLLKQNPDYIFTWDSDNIIPASVFDRLIAVMEDKKASLVSGLYFEKNKPFYPVLREFHSGGFWKIENPKLGEIIPIGACGMGCALIKTEVFRKMPAPWFKFNYEKWGYKDIHLSEDLYFCRSMLKAGMKLFCDTGLISAHEGGSVDAFEYMSMDTVRAEQKVERMELVEDMSKYMGLTEEEFNLRSMVGSKWIRDEWKKKNPKTDADKTKFYKETQNYLLDQYEWHFTKRRMFDLELVENVKRIEVDKGVGIRNILDFGCGIGQNAMMLARAGFDVTLAELESYTLDFAVKRFNKHSVPYKLWLTDKEDMPPDKKYDLMLLFDVLEHLSKKELKIVVDKLIKLKHGKTKILMTMNFGKSDDYPMHYDADPEYNELVKKLLNTRV